MKERRSSPAQDVITELGGVRLAAKKLGIAPSTLSAWVRPKTRGGLGGKIPGAQRVIELQEALAAQGIRFRIEDLVCGRKVG